jgi:hypothetical protein
MTILALKVFYTLQFTKMTYIVSTKQYKNFTPLNILNGTTLFFIRIYYLRI